MAETLKAQPRREREHFFEKYTNGNGIDIGSSDDPLVTPFGTVRSWDKQDGDATYMQTVEDNTFDFVYSSHCLEHIDFAHTALQNWFRITKRGGYLIVCVPHRDLYEKKLTLPSFWNGDHRHFWMPDECEPPCTYGLRWLIDTYLEGYEIVYLKTCDEGWKPCPVEQHSGGEYQIECVIKKV